MGQVDWGNRYWEKYKDIVRGTPDRIRSPDEISRWTPHEISGGIYDKFPELTPDRISWGIPGEISEETLEEFLGGNPKYIIGGAPDGGIFDEIRRLTSDGIPRGTPDRISGRIPGGISKGTVDGIAAALGSFLKNYLKQ